MTPRDASRSAVGARPTKPHERAYLIAYKSEMNQAERRRWNSWDDFMREWCRREDFRQALPQLLRGEDPAFVAYIGRLAEQETPGQHLAPTV